MLHAFLRLLIHAQLLFPESQQKAASCWSLQESPSAIPTSCQGSSPVMRVVATATAAGCTVDELQSQQQRRRIRWGAKLRARRWFSLTFARLCAVISSPRIRLLMPITTLTLWGVWSRTFGTHDLNCGRLQPRSLTRQRAHLQLTVNTSFLSATTVRFGSLLLVAVPKNGVWSLSSQIHAKPHMHTHHWSQNYVTQVCWRWPHYAAYSWNLILANASRTSAGTVSAVEV